MKRNHNYILRSIYMCQIDVLSLMPGEAPPSDGGGHDGGNPPGTVGSSPLYPEAMLDRQIDR